MKSTREKAEYKICGNIIGRDYLSFKEMFDV